MNTLLVDVGNTRIKLAVQREDVRLVGVVERIGAWRQRLEPILDSCQALTSVRIATVSPQRDRSITDYLRHCFSDVWIVDACLEQGGIQCAYTDQKQFGVDRWLAMLAAFSHSGGPLCVLDAGSAITMDVVTADGQHQGGVIHPGISSVVASMQRLGLSVEEIRPRCLLGKTTQECIDAGVGLSLRGMVHAVMQGFHEPAMLWLTGGDAALIEKILHCEVRRDDLLVLRGLAQLDLGDPLR